MHVLMTANAAWNIWNFRRPIIDYLIKNGHTVTILTPFDDSVSDIELLGCKVLPLHMNVKGLNPLEDLKFYCCIKQIFAEEQPDLILSYTIKNNIFGAFAAKSVGIQFIPNVTGLGTAFLSGKLLQTVTTQLYHWAFRKLPIIFFQNKDDRDLFLNRSLVRIEQVRLLPGSGIDLLRFSPVKLPSQNNSIIFLMVARLLRDKGIHEYVEAAKMIKAIHPEVRFQILGAIGVENRGAINETTVQQWIANGSIEYLGETDDVRPIISAASCVVLPSYREGAPRTLIEAAAMARPVIATDVPGCKDVVDHDITGFLCDAKCYKSLAHAMRKFINLSPQDRQAMGQAGRAKIEREYDQTIVIKAYHEAMTSLQSGQENCH